MDNEIQDILQQIHNRTLIALFVLRVSPPKDVREALVSLYEDIHFDSQTLIDKVCLVIPPGE